MSRRTLTIIDTTSEMREIDLDRIGKRELLLGRNAEQCEVVLADPIISKVQGKFLMKKDSVAYEDQDSSNGTFVANMGENRLLSKKDGYVELSDKSVLRIGNIHQPDQMVLLLYRDSEETEKWKRQAFGSQPISIGRDGSNQIVLHSPGVSKVHCTICRQNGKMMLYDRNSVNGVLVNGQPVRGMTALRDKDLIQILDFQMFYTNGYIYYRSATSGISLYAKNINKIVGRGKKKKKILNNVNCEIRPNEFVAIIGGSGAGKTTLMSAISGFDKEFTGAVYCNGVNLIEQFHSLKSIIGFVPQQDIIYENLTLKRMLLYTAKLKMPKDTQRQEMEQRIHAVLKMVDLEEHQNTYIRKLSGGQKKRASIAVELLADPKLFFLDEPTSGLDPGTEKNLMMTLSKLSKEQNKTIVMVTHTTQNLHLCDKVIFMGPGGRLCFCGNVEEAKKFYQTAILLPYLISIVVVAYLVYAFLATDTGLVNNAIVKGLLGKKEGVAWYMESKFWPFILTFVQQWKQIGFGMLLYLASILGIDKTYYEAAMLDGATKWQQIKSITLPLLKPTIIMLVILNLGQIFRSDFGLFYQVPMNQGALYSTTQTIDTYVYRALMVNNNVGMSAAASFLQSVVGFIFIVTANAIVNHFDKDSSLF